MPKSLWLGEAMFVGSGQPLTYTELKAQPKLRGHAETPSPTETRFCQTKLSKAEMGSKQVLIW